MRVQKPWTPSNSLVPFLNKKAKEKQELVFHPFAMKFCFILSKINKIAKFDAIFFVSFQEK